MDQPISDLPGGGVPAVTDTVHADMLHGFAPLVADLGGDAAALLGAVGIDPAALAAGRCAITYSQLSALLQRTAVALERPDFGMRLAARQGGLRVYGPLGPVMRHSRTFGEALRYVAGHGQAHSLAAHIWLRPAPDGRTFVGHDILFGDIAAHAQAIEQVLLVGHLGAIELTGGAVRARRVHFRHQPGAPRRVYRHYFGCEVTFGESVDGMVFDDRDLEAAIVDPDARRYGEAAAYIEAVFGRDRPPLHAQVRGIVLRSLGAGGGTTDSIAAELGLHPRTLHRRLRTEGVSFQRLKDEVRRDTMLYYLGRTALDLGEISSRLGFAEQCVMTRFCRRQLGASPSTVRRAARTGG